MATDARETKPHLICPLCKDSRQPDTRRQWSRRVSDALRIYRYACAHCGASWSVEKRTEYDPELRLECETVQVMHLKKPTIL